MKHPVRSISHEGNHRIVEIGHCFDEHNAGIVRNICLNLINGPRFKPNHKLIIDAKKTEEIDSAASSVLVEIHQNTKEKNGKMIIIPSPQMQRMFEIIGLNKFFLFHTDLQSI